jgi:hypothetical protein
MSACCWKCGVALNLPDGPVSFKATCDACLSYVHSCKGCRHYSPGKPNDCLIPGTDPIADRTAANLCEWFKLLGTKRQEGGGTAKTFNSLFKE